ncbi:MAG: MFS transporter [Intrasporangiaceae bacterium]|nr:MFS transporter [Intrasporangiaceae bacterium]
MSQSAAAVVPRARAILAVAAVGVALAAADTYVVVLALTDMMAGVGVTIDALQRATPIISGFLLGYIAILPLIGRVADLVARQRVLQLCLAIFVLGSVITALATDLPTLVGGRVVQGVGGGGLVPATLALVADLWPVERRGTPLGVVGAVQELGSVLGPALGAAILLVAQWRAIFWFNALAGVLLSVALVVVGRGARESEPTHTSSRSRVPAVVLGTGLTLLLLALWAPDPLVASVALGGPFVPLGDSSAVLLTPVGAVALVLTLLGVGLVVRSAWPVLRHADLPGALLLGGSLGCVIITFASADPETEVIGPLGYSLLPVAVVLAILYAWRHARAAEPLIPRGVVRARVPWALMVSFLVGTALVAVIVGIPLLSRLTVSTDQTVAAFELLKFLVAVPVGAVLGGWLLRWLGDGAVAGAGMLLAASALLLASSWGRGSLDSVGGTVGLVVIGFGMGLALAPVNNAALADAPVDAHGTASALVVVARMIGMVVGLAVLTAIGLNRYYREVAVLADATDIDALVDAAIGQVQTMLFGASVAAFLAAAACIALDIRRRGHAVSRPSALL